jgi:amino acid transporter
MTSIHLDTNAFASNADDQVLIEAGYKPQLLRRLGFFSSFAISFSYMSVITGIVANYGFVLKAAGPFGFWTWVLVGCGQLLTSLVFAEMAGRIPLAGCSYNWNSKLTSPTVGWFAGWMALVAYAVGVAAVTVTIFPVLESLFAIHVEGNSARVCGVLIILSLGMINVYGVRAAAYLNVGAVFCEIVALLVFGALLFGVWATKGFPNTELLLVAPSEPTPYWPAFLMASLMAGWTLLGFEGAADISEETIDVRRTAPKAIIRAVLACVISGLLFTMLLALTMSSVNTATSGSDPVGAIILENLGPDLAKAFAVVLLVAIYACALVNMTGASRLLFAMARDGRIPASSWISKVSAHRVPSNAVWLVTGVSAAFLCIADTATALYGAGAVLFTLFYLITVVAYEVARKRLPETDSFSLGRWHWPVVLGASAWLIAETGILTLPDQFHDVALATVIVLLIGIVLYFLTEWQRKRRG